MSHGSPKSYILFSCWGKPHNPLALQLLTEAEEHKERTLTRPCLLKKSKEIGVNDTHGTIGISLINHAGDVDLARSYSQSAALNRAVENK